MEPNLNVNRWPCQWRPVLEHRGTGEENVRSCLDLPFENSLMKSYFFPIGFLLMAALAGLEAATPPPVRVLVWDEQQPEQKRAYGDRFLGETIAAHLAAQPGFTVKNASLGSPSQGLDEASLNDTDVVIWWSHVKNPFVTDENVERIVTRVRQGKLGFMALHSAHWARPFVRLMQERAKDDALAQIPEAERAAAKFEYFNQNPLGKVPARNAPLTPSLRQEDSVWKLTLPGCIFPAYRGDGAPSHVTTLLPEHPIAAGLPQRWDVAQTEMYDEPFHVPTPDAVVFEERWDKGEHFRSGCVWKVGKGRVFYFRPGHETFPVFKQAEPLRVVENAARWLAQDANAQSTGRAATPGARFDPVLRDIEGWQVHVDPALIDGAHRDEGEKALSMLGNHLERIRLLVPADRLAQLQTIGIWIEHDTGQKVKHYALTDPMEYFAEGTEAYFYRNDFYPFVRAELKEHDPTLHEVLVKVWGPAD